MANYVNRVLAIGTVVRPVVLRRVKESLAVADFAIRVGDVFTDRTGRQVDRSYTIELVAFGETAERCANELREGASAFIQGRLKMEPRTAPDGAKISVYSVICDRVEPMEAPVPGDLEAQRRAAPDTDPAPAAPEREEPTPEAAPPAEPAPARAPRRRARPAPKPSGAVAEVAATVA